MAINKQLIASLFRSQEESSIRLAVILADYNIHYLKEVIGDQKLNPMVNEDGTEDRAYMCFGYIGYSGMFHTNGYNRETVWVEFPKAKGTSGILFSFD